MAVKNMADFLSAVTADYTSAVLSVTPQNVLVEQSDKKQKVHEADDGTVAVTSYSDNTIFAVTLQWDVITEEDAGTIFDFWNNSTKANGRERTFYWEHPTDGYIYTVRFLGPLRRSITSKFPTYRKVDQIQMRVEGVQP